MLSCTIENNQNNQSTPPEAKFCFTLTKEGISLLSVSDSVEALLGYKAEDFLFKRISLKELIHPHDSDIANALFANALADTSDNVNLRIRQANQRIRCITGHYTQRKNHLELFLHCAKSLSKITNDQTMMANFKAMMENTDDYIYFKDCNHVFTGASKTLVAITSPSEHWEDLLGLTDYDVFPEELADVYYRLEKQVFAGQSVAHEIQETLTKEGQKGWVDNRKYPIKNDTGQIIGLFGIARDITERKRAEEKLAHSHKLMHYIIENTNSAVAVHDRNLHYIYVSQRYLDDYKVNENDIIGKHHYDVFPDLPQKWRSVHQKALAGKISKADRDPYFRDDGTIEWTRWECRPWYEEDGSIGGIIVYTEVISDWINAEEKLRTSHERMLTILDSIDSTVYVADMDTGKILFMNKRMITDFGGDKTGDICYRAFWKNTGPCDYCTNDQLVDKHGNPTGVSIWHDKNPVTGKYCINYDRAIEWTDGRMARMQIATDITDLKKMEAQLHQAQKMESVGRLAGGMAHDFNNMLSVILGHTEMALEKMDPADPLFAGLLAVQQAAERSAALTRQLLAFARKQTIAPKVIDMNDTVVGMLNMLRRLIGEDIDLLWQPGINLRPVKVDPSQLDQLLANLCVNARDAITGVGKVTIETNAKTFDEDYCADHLGFLPGEYVVLEVSDDGCGMDKKTLNQIFEPFFTTKEQGQGTGLGLASVFGMVKQNNGFINVYSEPGQGTTFKIYLPAYAIKSDGVVEKAPDLPAEHGNETILLVEDESAILEMTTRMLERLGYTVVATTTPGEAIRLAHEYRGRIDLLLTDVVMPEMNGRQLAGNLLSRYPDIKRLFMSGYTANVIAHHGVLDDGMHFIQKPFSMKDLGSKLREVLKG